MPKILKYGGLQVRTESDIRFWLENTYNKTSCVEVDEYDVPGTILFMYNNSEYARRVLKLEVIMDFDKGRIEEIPLG